MAGDEVSSQRPNSLTGKGSSTSQSSRLLNVVEHQHCLTEVATLTVGKESTG